MTPDMLDFLRALHGAGARFLVIGGYALAFLGRPRFTKVTVYVVHPEDFKTLKGAFGRPLEKSGGVVEL